MAHFGPLCPAASGPLNPMTAPGQALRRLGVEALLEAQTSFGGGSIVQALALPFASASCALQLHREPDVPPVNSGWPYRSAPWGRLRQAIGQVLGDDGFRRQAARLQASIEEPRHGTP